MGEISFGQTVGMLKDAMDGASQTHSYLANNVANANTPGFKRTDVTFKEALARTEAYPGDPDVLTMSTTSDKHIIGAGAPEPPQPFEVTTTTDETSLMRADGSNVDVDQEMAKLSMNSAYAQTMGQLLQTAYSRLRMAIQERTS